MKALEFFTTREFAFATGNGAALWARMSPADRRAFPYADVAAMDWGAYMDAVLEGTKTFLLREDAAGRGPLRSSTRSRILRCVLRGCTGSVIHTALRHEGLLSSCWNASFENSCIRSVESRLIGPHRWRRNHNKNGRVSRETSTFVILLICRQPA